MSCLNGPVRTTAAGAWFLPADGRVGALLRVADGIPAGAVRRIRDLGLPGLLPIGDVVDDGWHVWLHTSQAPGPTLADCPPTGDAVAVLRAVSRSLAELHAHHLVHGGLDADAVLLDPAGEPLIVLVDARRGDPAVDLAAVARLARRLAAGWCTDDPEGAAVLQRCADTVEYVGLDGVWAVLASGPGHRRADG